jgi:Flp pilus assembly protein TadG
VLLTFGLIEFAEIFWTWNTMMLALGEGARFAIAYNTTYNPNGFTASGCAVTPLMLGNCAVGRAKATLATYPSQRVTVSCTAGCTGTPATMTLHGTFTFNFVAPKLLPYGPITITKQLTVPLS